MKNRKTGSMHPNASLTRVQIAKIWALQEKNEGWGCRRITEAMNLPENKRGAIERVLNGLAYREYLPESKKPRGLCVTDRGDEIQVFDFAKPKMLVVIRDGVATCTGYEIDYPVSNVSKLTLNDFAAILGGFESIRKEQTILKKLKKGKV